MVEWLVDQPWIVGIVTFFLMWSDWLLTILQERERQLHYAEHYESYPVNTIEGSPLFQKTVTAKRIAEPRHLIPALILSVVVALSLLWVPLNVRAVVIGYVWGLYFIVDTTHVGNLLGYRARRHGLHGKLFLHQRTGYVMQLGRYIAFTLFLLLLAVCSASLFIVGVAIAGLSSVVRQVVLMRRIPPIGAPDEPPKSRQSVPFQVIDWSTIECSEHKGLTGSAFWNTLQLPGLRIRQVTYSEGYLADHWCQKGHIVHCLEGELISEQENGERHVLKEGMSYVVSDNVSSHRSLAEQKVKLLIIDGDFLGPN